MKSKLYRVLVVLLAVAMMIPSFALADDPAPAGKTEWTTTAKDVASVEVSYNGTTTKNEFTYTITNTVKDAKKVRVKWSILEGTDVGSFPFGAPTTSAWVEAGQELKDLPVPEVVLNKVGTVKVSGQLWDGDGSKVGDAKAFTITGVEKKITKINLDEEKIKKVEVAKGKTINLNDLLQAKRVTPEDATYADSVIWVVESGSEEFVELNNWKVLTGKKKGTAKVHATTLYGTKVDSATVTVTITEPDSPDKPTPPAEPAYVALQFTEAAYTTSEVVYNLNEKLEKYENDPWLENLVWTSSDENTATVGSGYLVFLKEGTVTITAASRVNPEVNAKCTVTYKAPAKQAYTSIEFRPNTVNVMVNGGITIYSDTGALVLKGGKDDELVATSSDSTIATAEVRKYIDGNTNYIGVLVYGHKTGTATITVRSSLKPSVSAPLTVTVQKYEFKYTKLSFTEKSVSVKEETGTFDAEQYLIKKSENDTLVSMYDKLIWTSSNQQVFNFPNENSGKATIVGEGTATVTVRSKLDPTVTASMELVVEKVETPVTEIKLTQSSFELEATGTLYMERYVVTTPAIADTDDALIFTTDDTDVLTVDERLGTTTIISASLKNEGTAHVTVRTKLGKAEPKKFTIKLKPVNELKSISFVDAPKTLTQRKGETATVNLSKYLATDPTDFSGSLYWDSSDPQIATVNPYGTVTWQKAGTVTITVKDETGKHEAEHTMTMVVKNPVTAISLKNITLNVGEEVPLTNAFYGTTPVDGFFKSIRFVSFNRDVAEVQAVAVFEDDEDYDYAEWERMTRGSTVVAYAAGTTEVTATVENYDGSKVTGTFTVTVIPNDLERVQMSTNKLVLKKTRNHNTAKVRFNLVPFDAAYEDGDLYAETADDSIVSVGKVYVNPTSGKGYVEVYGNKAGTAWVTIRRTKDDVKLDGTKVVVQTLKVEKVSAKQKNITLYWYDDGTDYQDYTAPNTTYRTSALIEPVVKPSNAVYTVEYETSDPSVAFIKEDKSGAYVFATGAGKATVTIKVDDGKTVRTAKVHVTVNGKTPKLAISQTKATIKMVEGGDNTLKLYAYNADTDAPMKVKWTSSDTSVAKVSASGKVTAVGAGKATITATTKTGVKQSVKCQITVKVKATENKAKITGDEKVTVKVGKTKALNIKVKPAGTKVTYTSSDTKVVKVTKTGKIKGIKAGKATITVKTADGKASFKIKVTVK